MINLEFHKGSPCVYKAILCQEGWCSECFIFQKHSINKKPALDRYFERPVQQNRSNELQLVKQ